MKITNIPGKQATRVVDFPRLDGGLNLWELDYRLAPNQTPEMKNLWWQDGVLQCRDGQSFLTTEELGTGYTCSGDSFWGNAFLHAGNKIYRVELKAENPVPVEVVSGVPENRGTFFRYNENLYYKNRGGFFRISRSPEGAFEASDVVSGAYTPIILLNTDPNTGAGDAYQPENRLSPKKIVKYNASFSERTIAKKGDGSRKIFPLSTENASDRLLRVTEVRINDAVWLDGYDVDTTADVVMFNSAPEDGADIVFTAEFGAKWYRLPVAVDELVKVVVDGNELKEGTDYTLSNDKTLVSFSVAPPVHNPVVNNTVEIQYSKANEDAEKSILDCQYAAVYGGSGTNVCVVLGGSTAQPNAFFWNGNDEFGMTDSYWPVTFYQLAGDAKDGVTGFAVQYGELLVLKERSVGKSKFYLDNLDGRDTLLLTYEEINSHIGCDLPWTIALVENNVVFCSTAGGVYIVRESSSALENNIENISRNVNGTDARRGLLHSVRVASRDSVCAFDDDSRYWVCADGKAYLWDYSLSTRKDPSWFYMDNLHGVAYLRDVDRSYHVDTSGRVSVFQRTFSDYGGAIEKVYQFPPQSFGTYDRLKDVLDCVFAVRSDTDTEVAIEYQCDYGDRTDQTEIRSYTWRLSPRNLAYRFMGVQRFAHTARRKPGLLHVRHFAMRISNSVVAQDLAIISAQIYFRYSGRDR